MQKRGWSTVLMALLVAPLLAGCGVAAGGAAGAAAGMAYSDRGAQSYVTQDVATVATAVRAALSGMGIRVEDQRAEADEDEIEIKAEDGSRKVVVDIEGNRDAGQTHIYVSVSKNAVDYDKTRADEILRAIVARLQ
jgi:outer membrane lipoprotein SlyB